MAKGAYIGVDGVARKIKKGYVGVDGVARKIKKAYIGIGGVARPCWGGDPISYYGTITPLTYPTIEFAGTSFGDYALFSGGRIYLESLGVTYSSKTTAYNSSLTYSNPTNIRSNAAYLAATTVGNYALFGGGNTGSSTPDCSTYESISSYAKFQSATTG